MKDTILVVDDEPSNREVLLRILGREGWSVEQADDGRAALDRLRSRGIALVLTDLKIFTPAEVYRNPPFSTIDISNHPKLP